MRGAGALTMGSRGTIPGARKQVVETVPQWSFQHTDEDSLQRAVDRVHEKIEPNEFQRIKGHFCAHWARRHALMDTFL
jgi:hypothetical protein